MIPSKEKYSMKTITSEKAMSLNGGVKLFHCLDLDCCRTSKSYLTIFWHILSSGHFKSDPSLSEKGLSIPLELSRILSSQ